MQDSFYILWQRGGHSSECELPLEGKNGGEEDGWKLGAHEPDSLKEEIPNHLFHFMANVHFGYEMVDITGKNSGSPKATSIVIFSRKLLQ